LWKVNSTKVRDASALGAREISWRVTPFIAGVLSCEERL
jgi:hypothetical protein